MGGKNPYIHEPNYKLPTKKYRVTFTNTDQTVEVDPTKIPYHDTGLPGSVLSTALANNIDVEHACGGVCACSTCHIYVKEGLDSCSTAEEAELDMLDNAPDLRPESRLACQCVPNGEKDITVEVPTWSRNLAREGK